MTPQRPADDVTTFTPSVSAGVTSIGDGNADCHAMTPAPVTSFQPDDVTSLRVPLPGDDDPERWAAIFAEESPALAEGEAVTP